MKKTIIPVLALFVLATVLPAIAFHSSAQVSRNSINAIPSQPLASTLTQTTSESCSTVTPSGFGIDIGYFTLCGSPNSVSWGSPSGNFSIPFQLKVSWPGKPGPAQALQIPTFWKNSTTIAFNWVQSVSPYSFDFWIYFSNVSSSVYSKEITIAGNVSGLASGNYVTLTMPFSNPKNQPVYYNSSSPYVSFGNLEFGFGQLPQPVWSNQTSSLSFNVTSSTFSYDPLAEDGSASCTGSTSATSCNISLTTSNTNDVIIVGIATPTTGTTFTFSSSPSITWHARGSLSSTYFIKEEYAVWSGSGSVTITVTVSATGTGFSAEAFGISGANTASPFDSNAGFTYSNSGTSSVPTINSISSSNANDFFFGLYSSGSNTQTAGTLNSVSMTLIGNSGGEDSAAEYLVVSSAQSSVSMTFGTSVGRWLMLADAVVQSSASTVTLPFDCSMNSSAPSVSISISGGSPSPSSFSCDSSTHDVSINPSTSYTLSNPSATSSTRYFLNSTSGTSCSSGTCSTVYLSDREQVNLTNPDSLSVVRSANSTTQNSSSASYLWVDYGTSFTSTDSHASFLFPNITSADYLYNDSSGYGFQLLSNVSASSFVYNAPGNLNLDWNVSASTSSSEVGILSGYTISGNSSDYTLTSAIASLTGTGVMSLLLNPPYPIPSPTPYSGNPTTTTTIQYGSGLSIPNQNLNLKPGESQSITVTLNNLQSSQTLKLTGVSVNDSSGTKITVGQTTPTVQPYEQGSLSLDIQVLANTKSGVYTSTITVAYTEGAVSTQTSFQVTVTVGQSHTSNSFLTTLESYWAYIVAGVILPVAGAVAFVKREDLFDL